MQIFLSTWLLLSSPMTWLMLVLGAVIGSFLNVCIIRIPAGTFFKNSRSICDHCGKPIPFYLNIPVFSYILLLGRTACCKNRLSLQYPVIEFTTAVLFAFLYWHIPFSMSNDSQIVLDPAQFIRFAHFTIFSCVMLVCAVIDIHHQIIPDVLSLPMIVLAPLVALIHPELTLRSSLLGIIFGGGMLYVIAWIYFLIRKEYGLGMGDVKLLAAIGGWLGWQAVLPTVAVGSAVGAIVGCTMLACSRRFSMTTAIPFGPFLVLGAFVHFVFGAQISQWILSI